MINEENRNLEESKKNKQRPGLNAIRPDDFTENKFKEMAAEKKLSQTDMFKLIFWNYISNNRKEELKEAVDLSGEIELISQNLENIMEYFKRIAEKAQNTVISVKSNAEQTEKNLQLDIDTLTKKVAALGKRNTELEENSRIFNSLKEELTSKINTQQETINRITEENKSYKKTLQEKETLNNQLNTDLLKAQNDKRYFESEVSRQQDIIGRQLKTIEEKQTELLSKDKRIKAINEKLESVVNELTGVRNLNKALNDDNSIKDSKIRSLETAVQTMDNTINSMEKFKQSEISSIQARLSLGESRLKEEIEILKAKRKDDIEAAVKACRIECEADKKMALADMKLELAGLMRELAEAKGKRKG